MIAVKGAVRQAHGVSRGRPYHRELRETISGAALGDVYSDIILSLKSSDGKMGWREM
jgi:hypothetical protein